MIDKKQLIDELLECVQDATDTETKITGLTMCAALFENVLDEALNIHVVSFELPSDDIFDKPEVTLNNPLEEFYYYERPAYLKEDQRQFRERLQKALDYLKGN